MSAFDEPREIEGLRHAFREGATGESRPADPAFDADTVYRAASGTLSEPEMRRLIDALAEDPDLAEAWALARELVEAERRAARPATVTSIRPPKPARLGGAWTAIAATLALAVGVGIWQQLNPTPTWRGERREAAIHLLVEDGQEVKSGAAKLLWQSIGEGASYRVSVTTLDLSPVASGDGLTEPGFDIPATALAPYPPGTRFLWQVEARTREGRVVKSARSSFVLMND